MVVEILVAEGDAKDTLGDEAAQAVPDPLGVAVIGEAVRHLAKKRQVPPDPAQQQGAGIGSDGAAVEISHHTAASVGFKLQGLVLHYVGIGSPYGFWLIPSTRVCYQIPRTDASYLW